MKVSKEVLEKRIDHYRELGFSHIKYFPDDGAGYTFLFNPETFETVRIYDSGGVLFEFGSDF